MGKLNLSVGEIQGHLRQMLEIQGVGGDLTAEQRYSLNASIEAMEFLKTLSPGLRKAVDLHRQLNGGKVG